MKKRINEDFTKSLLFYIITSKWHNCWIGNPQALFARKVFSLTLKGIISKEFVKEKIDRRDILQITVGSLASSMTFAPIEEFHLISDKIQALNVVLIILVNLTLIVFIAYGAGVRKLSYAHLHKFGFFPLRVILIYGLSLFTSFFALFLYHLLPEPFTLTVVLKKILVLSLPATAGGSLLDLMDSKHR